MESTVASFLFFFLVGCCGCYETEVVVGAVWQTCDGCFLVVPHFLFSRVFHKMLYGFQGVPPTKEKDLSSKKRDLNKETKLKLFLKRSSEPMLNIQFPQVSHLFL